MTGQTTGSVPQRKSAEQHAAEMEALDRVRRRVLALGFFAVVVHGVVALVYLSVKVHGQDRTDDAIILLIMSGVVGVLMVAVMRLILRHSPWSPFWLVVGALPMALGIWLTFG